MSGQFGLCRIMSGEVGRKKFFQSFCRYGFASVFSFLEPTPGIGRLTTILSQTPDLRRSASGWGKGVMSGRFRSGQVGSERAVFPVLVFAFGVAHDSLLSM